jgi:hypothetical protein
MDTISNERGVIGDWIIKVMLMLAVVGVLVFDIGAIAVNTFGLNSTATDIANEIAPAPGEVLTQRSVEDEAAELAANAGARVVKVTFDRVNNMVSIRIRRQADTIVIGRIGPLEDWTRATAEARFRTQ